MTVGMLHPGSMGAAVAGQLRGRGADVLWHTAGRSAASAVRAAAAGLEGVDDLGVLVKRADVVISLCPPAAAESVAESVAAHGFAGKLYVEVNAITPQRLGRIAEILPDSLVIDAVVIGSPPGGGKRPRLYVAGEPEPVATMEGLFAGTHVEIRSLGRELGRASALKLAYSSYQKASRVLAALSFGLAEEYGVGDELLDVAGKRPGSYLVETGYIPKTASRAWRWGPEMEGAAELFREAGLLAEVMQAVAEVLVRWDGDRDQELSIEGALSGLRTGSPGESLRCQGKEQ
ncbi:DUF1932 domain-containing protein [Streptomyces sp. NPDC050610]|uniref:NAD(P)-dependent oxidoreductase n=1 Tax=Streptomyces sp. NPDC050610 TaxID=3157097 RepID=UPI00342F390E